MVSEHAPSVQYITVDQFCTDMHTILRLCAISGRSDGIKKRQQTNQIGMDRRRRYQLWESGGPMEPCYQDAETKQRAVYGCGRPQYFSRTGDDAVAGGSRGSRLPQKLVWHASEVD